MVPQKSRIVSLLKVLSLLEEMPEPFLTKVTFSQNDEISTDNAVIVMVLLMWRRVGE